MSHLHPPSAPKHQGRRKKKETYAPATVIYANKIFSIVSFFVTFVCASKSGLETTTGGINIGSGLERVFELKKVEEIHARDWASQLQSPLNEKSQRRRKNVHPRPNPSSSPFSKSWLLAGAGTALDHDSVPIEPEPEPEPGSAAQEPPTRRRPELKANLKNPRPNFFFPGGCCVC